MKTWKIALLGMLAVLALTLASCDNGGTHSPVEPPCACEPPEDTLPPITPPEKETLVGTSWQLVAFVDVATGESREPDYGERGWREKVYTITFINDSDMTTWSEINRLTSTYSVDYIKNTLVFHGFTGSEVCCDLGDGLFYVNVLGGISHFTQYPQELHLYYKNSQEYLRYNKIEYRGWE